MSRKKTHSQKPSENSQTGSLTDAAVKEYEKRAQAYCDGVLTGKIVAGRLQRLAVMRHMDDMKNAHKRGWVFNSKLAAMSCWFIENCLCHTKNSIGAKAGDPLRLTDTQLFIVWSLIGWRNKKTGYRRYQKAHIEVARKYGKSTFASALLLTLIVFDFPQEPEGEYYCAATKEQQAAIVFRAAKSMAAKSPALRDRLERKAKSITYKPLDSVLQPLGSDSDSTDGLNPSVIVMDELHAWQKRHRGFYEKLETGDGARLQPLTIVITTAGDDRAEIWIEARDWAVRAVESVITGEIVDDTTFSFICCIDAQEFACIGCGGSGQYKKPGAKKKTKCPACKGSGKIPADDPFDPACWPKANPNIGQSVKPEAYEKHANRARRDPVYLNTFLRYYCNIKVTAKEKAIDPIIWAQNDGEPFLRPQQFCRGGVDLGRSDDWAAWSLVFPQIIDELTDDKDELRTYDIIQKSYTCEARAQQLHTDQIDRWIEAGALEVHPGDQIDFDQIERDIVEVNEKYQVISWGFDPTFAPQMLQRLINLYGLPAHKFTQNAAWYNPGIRELLRALRRQDVSHGGDPVLTWQADNLVIVRNAQDMWLPDKSMGAKKIDAMVATLMGISDILYYSAEDETRTSVYEERGIRTL